LDTIMPNLLRKAWKRNYDKVVEITFLYYDKYYLKDYKSENSRILEFKTYRQSWETAGFNKLTQIKWTKL
jgi:hypothetical protein